MRVVKTVTTYFDVDATDDAEAKTKVQNGQGRITSHVERIIAFVPPSLIVPRKDWPMWAKVLAKRATPEDKGIGDVAARTIGPEVSGAFKAFYEMTFGKPCGCNGRQKLWNQKYPINSKAT